VRVLDATQELEYSLARLNGSDAERMTIGAGPILGVYLVPQLVGRFRETHPSVEISLRMGPAKDLIKQLVSDEIDVLLVGQLPDHEYASSIVTEKYFVDELHLVVATTHRLAGVDSISADSLRGLPFVVPKAGTWWRGIIDGHLRQLGVRPHVVLELDETEGIKRAVEANVGAAFLSEAAISQERASNVLRVLHVDGPPLVRPVYLMQSARRKLPSIARQFATFCRRTRAL
jgi:DNA-binding transcriptional LysR family regulator